MAKDTKTTKFHAPPKPKVKPTTLDERDYQYQTPKGDYRFYQGWDAAFKSALMTASREPGTNPKTRGKAVRILVEKGWSTADIEAAQLEVRKEADRKARERQVAKVEKAAKKAAKTETPVEPEAVEIEPSEVTPVEILEDELVPA